MSLSQADQSDSKLTKSFIQGLLIKSVNSDAIKSQTFAFMEQIFQILAVLYPPLKPTLSF